MLSFANSILLLRPFYHGPSKEEPATDYPLITKNLTATEADTDLSVLLTLTPTIIEFTLPREEKHDKPS